MALVRAWHHAWRMVHVEAQARDRVSHLLIYNIISHQTFRRNMPCLSYLFVATSVTAVSPGDDECYTGMSSATVMERCFILSSSIHPGKRKTFLRHEFSMPLTASVVQWSEVPGSFFGGTKFSNK
jgi:hypothetical protein